MTRSAATQTTDPRLGEGAPQRETPLSPYLLFPGEIAPEPDLTELTQCVQTLVNETGNLRVAMTDRPVKYNTYIDDLGDPEYELLQPFMALIEEYPDSDQVIAALPEVETFAEAPNMSEALIFLKNSILDLYDDLVSTRDDELGPLPAAWKRILVRHIRRIAK